MPPQSYEKKIFIAGVVLAAIAIAWFVLSLRPLPPTSPPPSSPQEPVTTPERDYSEILLTSEEGTVVEATAAEAGENTFTISTGRNGHTGNGRKTFTVINETKFYPASFPDGNIRPLDVSKEEGLRLLEQGEKLRVTFAEYEGTFIAYEVWQRE